MTENTGTMVKGVGLNGGQPHTLELSDGTALILDAERESGHVRWCRVGPGAGAEVISYDDALELAGEPFAGYVRTRTIAEAEWMHAVADWLNSEADELVELAAG